MHPFQQGKLDGLCGVYSIINSVKYLGYRCSWHGWRELFYEIVIYLYEQTQSTIFLTDGINTTDISRIFKHIVLEKFPIIYRKPFHNKPASIDELWDALFSHLNSGQRCTAILCIETDEYAHWTVIGNVSEKRMVLFDSDGLSWVNKTNCTTDVNELYSGKTIYIQPASLFLIQRKEKK